MGFHSRPGRFDLAVGARIRAASPAPDACPLFSILAAHQVADEIRPVKRSKPPLPRLAPLIRSHKCVESPLSCTRTGVQHREQAFTGGTLFPRK